MSDTPAPAEFVPQLKEGEYFDSAGQYNRATHAKIFQIEVLHGYLNHEYLWRRHREDTITSAELCKGKGPALILGSGPSLDRIMPRIKEWRGAVFCSTTQATTCAYWGKDPTYIVAMDVATREEELKTVDTWEGRETKMCIHPGLHPEFLRYWPLGMVSYRQMDPGNFYYTDVMSAGYPFITCFVMVFATTMATQMSLAKLMGYSPLILCGADLGYPDGKMRFTRYRFQEQEPEYSGPPFFDKNLVVMSDNGIITDKAMLFFKRALYCVWRLDRCQLLSASDGVLHELPHTDADAVINGQDHGYEKYYLSEQEIKDRSERYLAKCNTYFIDIDGMGSRLFETEDWQRGIPSFAANMIAQGIRGIRVDDTMDRIAAFKGNGAKSLVMERELK